MLKSTLSAPPASKLSITCKIFISKDNYKTKTHAPSKTLWLLPVQARDHCRPDLRMLRGHGGYVGGDQVPRLNVLDLQKQIRSIPKPVIAAVAGWAIGGGHVLHVVCDLTIAADNARFGQTGPKVGSFDGGFGSSYLARHVGQKKAREIWFLCEQYTADEAEKMGIQDKIIFRTEFIPEEDRTKHYVY